MKKVLFSHSYFLRLDPKQWKLQQPYPPLATIYAASVIRNKNFEVAFFDPMFRKEPEEIVNALESFKPDALVIYDDGFNYLTKMCLTNMRDAAWRMIQLAKLKGILVIVSGSDSTDHTELYLDAGADFVLIGEGENSLQELLEVLRNDEDPGKVRGLVYREGDKTVHTGKREVMKDLDLLPEPAWDLIHIDEYKKRWTKHHGYFSLNISTTRGCPFHCNWCAKPIYGNRYSAHSPARIAKEMAMLSEKYDATHFWITDDIFGLKPGWIQEFSEEVNKSGKQFKYKIQSRVDLLVQGNTIESLATSGCETVWMGAESGSQKILDAMDKGTKVSQISEATILLKKYGIKPAFFLQFGYPGENEEDIRMTLEMVMKLLPDDIGISVSYPLPGTVFYERVKNDLLKKSNWTDSDELAMMFQNTFPPEYYKLLQRFVHKHYRSHQGMYELIQLLKKPAAMNMKSLRRIAGLPLYFSGSLYYKKRMSQLLGKTIQHEVR